MPHETYSCDCWHSSYLCLLVEGTHLRVLLIFLLCFVRAGLDLSLCWHIECTVILEFILPVDVLDSWDEHDILNAATVCLLKRIDLVLEILIDITLVFVNKVFHGEGPRDCIRVEFVNVYLAGTPLSTDTGHTRAGHLMSSGHVFLADFAADEGHLDLLEPLVHDFESFAGTSSVLFGALLARVTYIIEAVVLDQLLPVQVLRLSAFHLQTLHFHGPELLLLDDGHSLT